MFKLLTDKAREEMTKEYSLRRSIVGLGGVCAILIMGIISLLPSYIISNARMNEVTTQTEVLSHSASVKDAHALVLWLNDFNQKLSFLAPSSKQDKPDEFFLNIFNAKKTGIKITHFTWKREGKTVTATITGVASSRQSLVDFEDGLNSSGNFSKVILPISNFAKDKDIDFDISLSPAKS